MATQGPNAGGTFADDSSAGLVAWANPGNAAASDNSRATAELKSGSGQSHLLKATNFGFSIPAGATINGIVVDLERSRTGTLNCQDLRVSLYRAGVLQAANRASTALWGTADTTESHGGAADLWSASWTPSDINNSGFGAGAQAVRNSGTGNAQIDFISITVTYTGGGGQQVMVRVVGL